MGWISLLDFALAVIAGILAYISLEANKIWPAVLSILYILILLVKFTFTIRKNKAADVMKGEVLRGIFHWFDDTAFDAKGTARYTLFVEDPLNSDFIIPWYRHRNGVTDVIAAAEKSHARYRSNEGYTGTVWFDSLGNDFRLDALPDFANRADFEQFYTEQLGINPHTVSKISSFMEDVGIIISWRFSDFRGKFLGLVSIDLQLQLASNDDDGFNARSGTGEEFSYDSDTLGFVGIMIQNVLRSFAQAESR